MLSYNSGLSLLFKSGVEREEEREDEAGEDPEDVEATCGVRGMVVLVGEREEERRGEERRGEKADEAREVEVAEQEVNWAHGVQGLVSTRGSVWRVTKERGRMTLDGQWRDKR